MATNKEMLASAFQEKVAIRSVNLAKNFWDQTISKSPFRGHFEFCNIYLTQEMQNDWTMNIKQNLMSHTRITHDRFYTKKSKMTVGHFNFNFFY